MKSESGSGVGDWLAQDPVKLHRIDAGASLVLAFSVPGQILEVSRDTGKPPAASPAHAAKRRP